MQSSPLTLPPPQRSRHGDGVASAGRRGASGTGKPIPPPYLCPPRAASGCSRRRSPGNPPRSASASRPRPPGEGAAATASDRAPGGRGQQDRGPRAERGEGCGAGGARPLPAAGARRAGGAAASGRRRPQRGALEPRQDEPQCHLRQSQAAETCAENVSGPAGRRRARQGGGERATGLPGARRPALTAPRGPGGGGRGTVRGRAPASAAASGCRQDSYCF